MVVSTIVLFATGVALLATGETEGSVVGLHKASFIVWLGATGIHVLLRLAPLVAAFGRRVPGLRARLALAGAAVLAGAALATLTLPAADHLQDEVSAQIGFDAG